MKKLRFVVMLLAALSLTACGEPLVVLGDWPGVARLVAGVANTFNETDDQLALRAHLGATTSVVAGPNGSIYVAAGRRIVQVLVNGRLTTIVDHRSCTGVCIADPEAMALDANGNLVIADPQANRVFRVDTRAAVVTVIAGNGQFGKAADGTAATSAPLGEPAGVAVGADGRVYFSEQRNNIVRRIENNGALSTAVGTGVAGFTDNVPALQAQLSGPGQLLISGNTLYISDIDNSRVRTLDLNGGSVRTIAGNGAAQFSGDGGPALSASLRHPAGLTLADQGNTLIIADAFNHRVRAVNLGTGVITTLVGSGATEYAGDGRSGGETALNLPNSVATAEDSFLYVADTGHHVVWRVSLRQQ